VFPPELFILVGVNVFVALSLLTSIFDEPFPTATPYVFQIAAIIGFGQIWANCTFLFTFMDARFWCSMLYLFVVVIGVTAINLYIAINKRLLNAAGVFLGAFTIPTVFMFFLLVSAYLNGLAIWMPPFPIVPFEAIFMVFALCIIILGLSVLVYLKPGTMKKLFLKSRKPQHLSKLPNTRLSPTYGSEQR
jgi:hypothetical protein